MLSGSLIGKSSAQIAQTKERIPSDVLAQAIPVYNLLKAVETSDFNLYKSVWSLEDLKKYPFDNQDWQRIRREEIKFLHGGLGVYKRKALRYSFNGDDARGVVSVASKGQPGITYNVVNENGVWKVHSLEAVRSIVPPIPSSKEKVRSNVRPPSSPN
jgi:hypothetical protein